MIRLDEKPPWITLQPSGTKVELEPGETPKEAMERFVEEKESEQKGLTGAEGRGKITIPSKTITQVYEEETGERYKIVADTKEEKPYTVFVLNQRKRTLQEKTSYRRIKSDRRFLYGTKLSAYKSNG